MKFVLFLFLFLIKKFHESYEIKKSKQHEKNYMKKQMSDANKFLLPLFLFYHKHRCTNSELKYGPAVTCQQCKQRSAFNRPDHKVCVRVSLREREIQRF